MRQLTHWKLKYNETVNTMEICIEDTQRQMRQLTPWKFTWRDTQRQMRQLMSWKLKYNDNYG